MSRRSRTRAAATAVKRMYVDDRSPCEEGDDDEGSTADLSQDDWFAPVTEHQAQQGEAHAHP